MDAHGGLRAKTTRTVLFVALAAAYYLALNAFLIHEIVDRVRQGPPGPVATRPSLRVETQEPEEVSASCAELARADRDICWGEALLRNAAAKRRQRRAEHAGRRAATVSSAAADAGPRNGVAAVR